MSTAQNIFSHSQIPTARQMARGEISSVRVKVFGYWSSDTITIYARVDYFRGNGLKIDMTHSSGGREPKEVVCDIQAEENFGIALQGAAVVARQIQAMGPEVMTEHGIYKAELEAYAKTEQDAKDAAVAADPSMLLGDAQRVVEAAKAGLKFKLFKRGETEAAYTLYRSGRLFYLSIQDVYYSSDMAIGKYKLLTKLCGLSARYTEFN
jgi:hypothetical protein